MNTICEKSHAYLIRDNYPVAIANTSARNGETVTYGSVLPNGCIHAIGRAKVSRAKKWRRYDPAFGGKTLEFVYVNRGGGAPI